MPLFTVDLTVPGWIDTGLTLTPGQGLSMTITGQGTRDTSTGQVCYPEGCYGSGVAISPEQYDPSAVNLAPVGDPQSYPAGPIGANAPPYAMVLLILPVGQAPPLAPVQGGTQVTNGLLRPNRAATFTPEQIATAGGGQGPWKVWVVFNDNLYSDNAGQFEAALASTGGGGGGGEDPDPGDGGDNDGGGPPVDRFRRFLRVDWSQAIGSRFVTRVRFKLSGPGAENAAIALVTGFDEPGPPDALAHPDPADVIIPQIPLTDEENEDALHAIDLPVPQLARGIAFYPDYLLESDEGASSVLYPALTLSHLQVYETENEGVLQVPLPTVQRSRVGVQEVKIYPWAGSAGPYDATTAGPLFALQNLDITKSSTSAKVKGGETVHTLGSFEVDRETKVKASAAQTDLRTMQILLGGDLSVTTAGDGGEIQYTAENLKDRAPYFRLAAKSTNGDGQDSLVFFKLKVTGGISFNLTREQVTNLEFEADVVYDSTAARQDGKTGGLVDWIFASKGEPTIHS